MYIYLVILVLGLGQPNQIWPDSDVETVDLHHLLMHLTFQIELKKKYWLSHECQICAGVSEQLNCVQWLLRKSWEAVDWIVKESG